MRKRISPKLVSLLLAALLAATVFAGCCPPGSGVTPRLALNEVMFDPLGEDDGNEWVELYHQGRSSVNGWTISNRSGEAIAVLPNWNLPHDCYLVVYFGEGTDDSDFSDGNGAFYVGGSADLFDNTEDEVALYSGAPDSSTIVDFVSWCCDGEYDPGEAHSFAESAGMWDSGEFFDTGFPTGTATWDGNSIGRDGVSTDTDEAADWDTTGGADAYYPSAGAANSGPLYTVHDAIKWTQLQVNMMFMTWGYQVLFASHEILEEYQMDDETYVRAEHSFDIRLGGLEAETFAGQAEYLWLETGPSAWDEEVSIVLSALDLAESFAMTCSRSSVAEHLERTIDETVDIEHSYQTWDVDVPYPDDPWEHPPTVEVLEDSSTSTATITITQTGSNEYHTEIVQEADDGGVLWDMSLTKDEMMSYGSAEGWTVLQRSNNVEEPATISTHYTMSVGQGWLDGGIGDLDVSYEEYSAVIGSETYVLDGPGYLRLEEVSDNSLQLDTRIEVGNVDDPSDTLDLGSSGDFELLYVGGEEVIRGKCVGNALGTDHRFYIDGAARTGAIGAVCGIAGLLGSSLAIGAPVEATNPIGWGTWLTRGVVTAVAGSVCAIGGAMTEPDTTKPQVTFTPGGSGQNEVMGHYWLKVTAEDESGLDKIHVVVKSTETGETLYDKYYQKKPSGFSVNLLLSNTECASRAQDVIVTAWDDTPGWNRAEASRQVMVPARVCGTPEPTEPAPGAGTPTPSATPTPPVTPTPTSTPEEQPTPGFGEVLGASATHTYCPVEGLSFELHFDSEHWAGIQVNDLQFCRENGEQFYAMDFGGPFPVGEDLTVGFPWDGPVPDVIWIGVRGPGGLHYGWIRSVRVG